MKKTAVLLDLAPYRHTETHPVTRKAVDFSGTATFVTMNHLIREFSLKDDVAYRSGELSFDGWTIRKQAAKDLIRTGRQLIADDFVPAMKFARRGVFRWFS